MAYRRDRKRRRTSRLLIATALSITPAIHGCGIEQPTPDDNERFGEQLDGGNPKGSFYDEGLVDQGEADAGDLDVGYPDVPIFSNPKGCFFDEGLTDAYPDAEPADAGDGSTDSGDGSADGEADGMGGMGGMDDMDGTGGAGGMGGGGG